MYKKITLKCGFTADTDYIALERLLTSVLYNNLATQAESKVATYSKSLDKKLYTASNEIAKYCSSIVTDTLYNMSIDFNFAKPKGV